MKKVTLQIAGGALAPTGANFLVKGFEKTFLVDCGLLQGTHMAEKENWKSFSYNPEEIDTLFVTHAHLDHIGLIPKLVHEGFRGQIISTPATKDIAQVMLLDTMSILSASESGKEFHLDEIYNPKHIETIMSLWKTYEYHENISLGNDLRIRFLDAGHILGSAMVECTYNNQAFIFTGDLGNSPSPLLPDTEVLPSSTKYLLMESVYGDRNHEERDQRLSVLTRVLKETYEQRRTLVIPIFSLERTQEFLYEMNELVEAGVVHKMPIILDSPLASEVTEIFKSYKHLFKKAVQDDISSGDDIFNFPGFRVSNTREDSESIHTIPNPKVILAGSGMSTGGRVIHHHKEFLGNPHSTVLITGFQTPGTLGRELVDGAREVMIHDEKIPVKARVEVVKGYSGHKDSDHLLAFVEPAVESLQKVIVAMGELKASTFLAQRIHDTYDVSVEVPQPGAVLTLDFDD